MSDLTLAYVLIAVGGLLLAADLFVPTGGMGMVAGLALAAAGVIVAFVYDARQGWLTLAAVVIAEPILLAIIFYLWPYSPAGKKMQNVPTGDDTVATMPGNVKLEALRGRLGTSVSTLRPSGTVEFDGRRIDCITEGMMVEAGRTVKCIDVRAGKVVVRAVERPTLGGLENADFG